MVRLLLTLFPFLALVMLFGCGENESSPPSIPPIIEAPVAITAVRECQETPSTCAEVSTDFDAEHLTQFLNRLPPLIESGFSGAEIDQIIEATERLELDEEEGFEFPIRYRGDDANLGVFVFVDDIDTFSVFFLTLPDLATAIDQEMTEFFDEISR